MEDAWNTSIRSLEPSSPLLTHSVLVKVKTSQVLESILSTLIPLEVFSSSFLCWALLFCGLDMLYIRVCLCVWCCVVCHWLLMGCSVVCLLYLYLCFFFFLHNKGKTHGQLHSSFQAHVYYFFACCRGPYPCETYILYTLSGEVPYTLKLSPCTGANC